MTWLKDDETVYSIDQWGRPILTVGALRALLEDVDDLMHVVLDDGDGWYVNVDFVIVPGSNRDLSEWSAVTLGRGGQMDTRQF